MRFSIITPSFNQGRFIERTLTSVSSQLNDDSEHVVFDGGSSDATVEILQNFTPAVRWVSRPDRGQTHAVNQGITSTSGEIIGWLNSDDIYYPGALQKVSAFLEANPDVDVVYGMADHIDIADQVFEEYPTEPWDLCRLKEKCFISQPALFMRRRVVDKYGLLDESLNFCMDYEYWLRLGINGAKFGYMREKLAATRIYAETKTIGSRPTVFRETFGMLKDTLGYVPEAWILAYARFLAGQDSDAFVRSYYGRLITALRALWLSLRWNSRITLSLCRTLFPVGRLAKT